MLTVISTYISNFVRTHWKTSILFLIGYWLTYAILCTATGQPIVLPTVTVSLAKTIGL